MFHKKDARLTWVNRALAVMWLAVSVLCLFLKAPWVGLLFVMVAFPIHTHIRLAMLLLHFLRILRHLVLMTWQHLFITGSSDILTLSNVSYILDQSLAYWFQAKHCKVMDPRHSVIQLWTSGTAVIDYIELKSWNQAQRRVMVTRQHMVMNPRYCPQAYRNSNGPQSQRYWAWTPGMAL